MTVTPYFTFFNSIDNRWKVVDTAGYVYGDGKTEKDAVLHCINTLDISIDEIKCDIDITYYYLRFYKTHGEYEVWECHMNPDKDATISKEKFIKIIEPEELSSYISDARDEIESCGNKLRSIMIEVEI